MGDTFTIGQAQDTFTVGIGADGFTVAPEVNLFEVGADVTTITVNYGAVSVGVAGGDAADFTAYAIDSATAVNGSATTIAFMNSRTSDAVGSPIPVAFLVGTPVFRPDILDANIYTVTASGAWTVTATLDGAQTIESPIQNRRYVGTNTTDPGGVGTDPNDVATTIVPHVPYAGPEIDAAIDAALADLIQPDVTPSFTAIFDLATSSPFSTGSVMAIASYEGYTFVNGDCFIVDGATTDPLVGYWRLPTAGIGQTAVKLTDGDNVQGVLYEVFSQHNHLLKIAEGYRGQRLAMAYRDDDGVSAREMHWLSGVNVRPYDAADVALYDDVTTETVDNVTIHRYHVKSQPDVVWIEVDAGAGSDPTVSFLTSGGTVPATARLVRCDTTSGSFNVTLADDNPNAVIVRNESGSGTVTVKDSGGGTIAAVAAGEEWQFTYLTGSTWSAWKESPADSGLPATGTNGQLLAVVSGDPAWADVGDLDIQPHSDRLSELATLNTNDTVPLQVAGAWTAGSMSTLRTALSISSVGMFGTGADGDVTFSSNTTITSDFTNGFKNYRNVTINSGVTLTVYGHLFISGTLTNNGTISANGNNGALNAGGATVGGPYAQATASNAGPSGANNAVGSAGSPTTNPGSSQVVLGGGRGGSGGTANGGASAGGVAGVLATLTSMAEAGWRSHLPSILSGNVISRGVSSLQVVGAGTGGGGGAGSGGIGGGGGGGGGSLVVLARHVSGSGTITANGGNGGNAFSGNSGGGGGGGGGFAVLVTNDTSTSITLSATGGTAGTGLGTGASGVNGSAGNTLTVLGAV